MIEIRNKLLYALATTLHFVAWGVVFTFTTRYVAVELKGGVRAMMLFTALNWGFTLFGLLAGTISQRIGEKKTILLGTLCSPPLLLATLIEDPYLLSILISITTLPWVLSWSVVIKVFFSTASGGQGKEYGEYTVGTGLGFFIGSVSTGILYGLGGPRLIFVSTSIMLVAPPFIYYWAYPASIRREKVVDPSIEPVVKKLSKPFMSLLLAVFTRELLYSIAPNKLDSSLELILASVDDWLRYMFYGIVYSGGALISPLVRLIAGRIVDKYGAIRIYVATVAGYVLVYWLFIETYGLTSILVWQIPLYPFLDISFNTLVAQKLKPEQLISGFGATQAFTALGGLFLLPLLIIRDLELRITGLIISFLNTLSILIIATSETREKH